ncbi:DUF924 family protein [Pararhizobium sp.]|uniref:DUF924 family protein n=1 Tax=Pararhizobium sp. TaxID=1977563 RepID=UPI00271FE33F|nr:DUF924 family protein [Pararhizobium sp.]MDO9418740.1 DUF924 family protein [Pararhizobium sp.]
MTLQTDIATPDDILKFWFEELTPEQWFNSTPDLDRITRERFRATHLALAGEIGGAWHMSGESRLAAIIVLDQFPRNMYRATPLAFATDGLARREAAAALANRADLGVDAARRCFFYFPLEHSETLEDQTLSVQLFTELANADYLDYAIRHREVIEQFGRFPHRNRFLGRVSTSAEEAYLAEPGSGF